MTRTGAAGRCRAPCAWLAAAVVALSWCGAGTTTGCVRTAPGGGGGAEQPDDTQVEPSLLYVLQPEALTTEELVAAGFGWLVLEPSRNGLPSGELTASEITDLRTGGPCGGKIVLAYLSIGEAESYRSYFDPGWLDEDGAPIAGVAPAWLGPSNPDFPGNFKVRYWDPGWQSLILGTPDGNEATPLDRILNAGFDGVYLDIVDAYDFWSSVEGGNELTRREARARMIAWVGAIAAYARQTRGAADFLVFPQNAADILADDDGGFDELTEEYLAAVDGIGIEDLFYDETTAQPADETQYVLEYLREFRRRGKTVLVTDYVLAGDAASEGNTSRAQEFHRRVRAEGFVPYAAQSDRDLDEIVALSRPEWPVSQPPEACLDPQSIE